MTPLDLVMQLAVIKAPERCEGSTDDAINFDFTVPAGSREDAPPKFGVIPAFEDYSAGTPQDARFFRLRWSAPPGRSKAFIASHRFPFLAIRAEAPFVLELGLCRSDSPHSVPPREPRNLQPR